MKPNALFPILFIQNNKKKSGTDIFYQIIAHVHFREILSGYFLFSRFDWSIFVTQLVAKHMKEIIKSNDLQNVQKGECFLDDFEA
jgi:hypothetical protein